MSRGNILEMTPDTRGLTVTFSLRRGGTRSYHYGLADGAQIMAGSDPAEFTPDGEGGSGSSIENVLTDVSEEPGAITAIEDIGEGVADIGFLL